MDWGCRLVCRRKQSIWAFAIAWNSLPGPVDDPNSTEAAFGRLLDTFVRTILAVSTCSPWITAVETIKRQTRVAYGWFVVGQSVDAGLAYGL